MAPEPTSPWANVGQNLCGKSLWGKIRKQKETILPFTMNTDRISRAYVDTIIDRHNEAVQKVNDREDATLEGRTIPDDDSLVIGQGRKLELAVLFVDICGFTAWRSSTFADQERILMIFSVFMTELFKIANDYGGQIEKNTGDGLMAYFVGEGQNKRVDACEKATAAALSMFFVTEHLINPLLIRSGFQTIDFRIGIDYGRVTIARVGAARIFNSNVAIGISANIASKMLRDAGKNEIIIGNDVYISLTPGKKSHCTIFKTDTPFFYFFGDGTSNPYHYYKFDARWVVPA